MELILQESIDGKTWSNLRMLSSIRECFLEVLGFEESFKTIKSQNTFEWKVVETHRTFHYRILKRGAILKKEERLDPRTSLPKR